MRRTKFGTLVSICILVLLLVGQTSQAEAESNEKEIIKNKNSVVINSVDNPCTPQFEGITLSGTASILEKTFTHKDGRQDYQLILEQIISGTDPATGIRYIQHSREKIKLSDGDGVLTFRERVISSGPSDNFFLVLTVRVDDFVSTIISSEAVCKG
jgi:hypothetical protein